MFIYRSIGWNMKNSGHYTFWTVYSSVCLSFIKHDTQRKNPIHDEFQCCQVLYHATSTVLDNWHIYCGKIREKMLSEPYWLVDYL